MKTIEHCIKENDGFLLSLKSLLVEALEAGEDEHQTVFIFVEPYETTTEKIIVGSDIVLFGKERGLIFSYGYNISQLLKICNEQKSTE